MEFVQGEELFDFIGSNPQLPENISRHIFRQIVSAVDYCHNSCISHRGNLKKYLDVFILIFKLDLKPENILIDKDLHVTMLDFGLSTFFQPDDGLHSICGSPSYVAPEIILGSSYSGILVDIWR